ncbi:translation initiation factor IF3-1, mitochondrial isoform X1 [Telopea speciosissima]|uniref:translation initiation factor IF3-1, mitochondrial isoform X1 n=1 Tax=Telopea speciosissima TaxID=54955 RepID=UPI001CC43738|nr:translation initiation factor IF3-1, mitochondrial isoform X1 [Telopea speciosissima]
MAFWCRIRYSRLNSLSSRWKRCYFQAPDVRLANYISGRNITQVSRRTDSFFRHRSGELYDTVRFFAAPVQAKSKVEVKDSGGPRINGQITAEFIRLVMDEGHAIVSRREALERARKLKLDLVEVQRNAKPPVCKIMDFHREKYKQQVKEKDKSKTKSEVTLRKGDCKEVRFSGKTEQKDLQMKADTVKRLMERGYRVKCMVMGTEDQDLGGLLSRLSSLIEEFSIVESGPRVEKRQAYVIVRHIKFGPSKKGPSKKATKAVGTTGNEVPKATTLPPTLNSANSIPSAQHIEDKPSESGLETEDEFVIDEADSSIDSPMEAADGDNKANNAAWSVFNNNDEFAKVFDFDNNRNGVGSSSADVQMDGAAVTISQRENVDSVVLHPKPVPGTMKAAEPSLGGENTCRNSDPVSRLQPSSIQSSSPESNLFSELSEFSSSGESGHVNRGSGGMDLGRVGSQFPIQGNQGRQRQTVLNVSPSAEQKQFGIEASLRKVQRPSTDETQKHMDLGRVGSQFPIQGNQGRQRQTVLNVSPSAEQKQFGIDGSLKKVQCPSTDETQKHGPSQPSPTSPASSYGIFSTPEPTTPRKENAGMEGNRDKERNSFDAKKSQHLSGIASDPKPSTSHAESRQRPDVSTSQPGGWGIFSREGSGGNNSRVSDNENRVQR